MSKLSPYAVLKPNYGFVIAWAPKKIFSEGVEVRHIVPNIDTCIGIAL
jgi:hypothetical protein